MKHTKLLVLALLVALLACLAVAANADDITCQHPDTYWKELNRVPATCLNDGYVTYACTMPGCGAINTKTLYAKGSHTRSGEFACANPTDPVCKDRIYVEICAVCKQHVFTDNQYTIAGQPCADETIKKYTDQFKAPTCTTPGRAALYKCTACGKINPKNEKYNGYSANGAELAALGHDFSSATWKQDKAATCASEGKAYLECTRANCYERQYQVTPKTSFHTDGAGNPITTANFIEYMPAKPATCTEPGCDAIHKCPTCGYIDPLYCGTARPALGHKMVVDPYSVKVPTCTTPGESIMKCARVIDWGGKKVECGHYQVVTAPALGHSATWIPVENKGAYVLYELICSRCKANGGDGILASQLVRPGIDKAPSGNVNTGKAATTDAITGTKSGVKTVAKKGTTTTKKTATTKKTTTAAKAAAPVAAAATTAAEGVEIKATGITVINDDVAIKVKDGKLIVLGEAAEDETVAVVGEELKAIAEDEAYVAGMKIAVVKTADLPAATASK